MDMEKVEVFLGNETNVDESINISIYGLCLFSDAFDTEKLLPAMEMLKHGKVINMEWGNFGSSHFPRTSSKIDLDVENQNINDQRGVLVYLRGHEGRGTRTGHKLRAYNLQDDGRDTIEANEELSLPVDSRKYGIGAQILRDVGVKTMKLMTNNVAKYSGLKGYGLEFLVRVPLSTTISKHNKAQQEIS
ncbi:bifunctional riboflavin biosynthesis protein RIBA 1, chloroplastic-like protein [Tanacetum coccineum]